MNALDMELKQCGQVWTVERVEALVADSTAERSDLEFKERPDRSATTTKPWAALANSGGGSVVYGIREDELSRAVAAQPIELDGLRERFQQLNESIDPPVDLSIEVLPLPSHPSG